MDVVWTALRFVVMESDERSDMEEFSFFCIILMKDAGRRSFIGVL